MQNGYFIIKISRDKNQDCLSRPYLVQSILETCLCSQLRSKFLQFLSTTFYPKDSLGSQLVRKKKCGKLNLEGDKWKRERRFKSFKSGFEKSFEYDSDPNQANVLSYSAI